MEASELTHQYAPPAAPLEHQRQGDYFAVSKRKLAIMVIGTSCLYAIYWFYRQWKAYAQSTGGSQWAWARGFFWWAFAYNLFGKLDKELRARGEVVEWTHNKRGLILIVTGVSAFVISMFGPVYSLVPSIIAAVVAAGILQGTLPAVNRLANDVEGKSNGCLTWANWIWLLVGATMWIIAVGGVALMIAYPETQVS